jgi:hypothetical protein
LGPGLSLLIDAGCAVAPTTEQFFAAFGDLLVS